MTGSRTSTGSTLSLQAIRALVRNISALVAERAQAEQALQQRSSGSSAAIRQEYAQTRQGLEARLQTETERAEARYQEARKRIEAQFARDDARTRRAEEVERANIQEKAEDGEATTRRIWDETVWAAETVYEAKENQPQQAFEQACRALQTNLGRLRALEEEAGLLLRRYRQKPPARARRADDEAGGGPLPDAQQTLADSGAEAEARLEQLSRLRLLWLFADVVPFVGALLPVTAVVLIIGFVDGWRLGVPILAGGGAALLVTAGIMVWLYRLARSRALAVYALLREALASGQRAHAQCLVEAREERDRREAELKTTRAREIRDARAKYEPILEEIRQRRRHHLQRIEQRYPKLLQEIRQRYEHDLQASREEYQRSTTSARQAYERESRALESRHQELTSENRTRDEAEWSALQTRWKEGMALARAQVQAVNDETARLFPGWTDPTWRRWAPPQTFAPVIRFGGFEVDINELPGGLPADERLRDPGPARFGLPAVLSLPQECSLLLETGAEGRGQAVTTLQTVMMRLLTSLPPGKIRFTIVDPLGLGQNFAGFMHLADYNDAFVGGKIWTETRHIEQRLADLTEHMENVIQKYLRNEYETIAQYNDQAGEIAEPYRFVVVCDFPTNFSDTAARRLASILDSGARCGVYTLISRDTRQDLPRGIDASDLRDHTVNLVYERGRFVWKDEDFEKFPLALDPPPQEAFVTDKLKLVGRSALDSTRVEVPFDVVVPAADRCWSGDGTTDVRVPLGRAGATRLQHLTLGHGTNQHALIAGKTGSGKSTLLHVLITNLALWYSPDEVELYLVDFKKGVEFKTYATHDLPHARTVAIESDREFGLSVLQRLDQEMKRRGNAFRELGVQDLAGYRRASKRGPMPRTLLVIDEFQEFFVEDDKIAQDSAMLLDRLVRQGRAFGIHVLLGSQTLGGAYTLARSTIGQMGVRIALQCSETDSYLIFSDDNSAARLLSRPGEAIYNDANGQVEGNSPFQVVWLPEPTRERYLEQVHALARKHSGRKRPPQIVFEGNVPADVSGNRALAELLGSPTWPSTPAAPRAWLGEAVAIKDATAVELARRSGSNLIVAGQQEESALSLMAISLVSLAAQRAPADAQLWVLDGTPADSPHAGYLAKVASVVPHEARVVAWREVDGAMAELAGELSRRQAADQTDAPAVFVLVFGIQRFRMLRRAESDFGFGLGDEAKPPSPDRHFADLVREGPPLGMHTLLWCDTVTNLERTFERQGLREFDNRVLFQMSAPDSTNLIDTPQASKLGIRRALLANEERGTLEKFRPYALPTDEWLAQAKAQLSGKAKPSVSVVKRGIRTILRHGG